MCWVILSPVLIRQKPPGKTGFEQVFQLLCDKPVLSFSRRTQGRKAPWQKPANKHCPSCAWSLQAAAQRGQECPKEEDMRDQVAFSFGGSEQPFPTSPCVGIRG